MVGFRSSKRS